MGKVDLVHASKIILKTILSYTYSHEKVGTNYPPSFLIFFKFWIKKFDFLR